MTKWLYDENILENKPNLVTDFDRTFNFILVKLLLTEQFLVKFYMLSE